MHSLVSVSLGIFLGLLVNMAGSTPVAIVLGVGVVAIYLYFLVLLHRAEQRVEDLLMPKPSTELPAD